MKKRNTVGRQMGFFDLGFSLAVLALSGAFAYAMTLDQDDKVVLQEPQIQVVANYQEGREDEKQTHQEHNLQRITSGIHHNHVRTNNQVGS